jgi:hypothetical protein
VKSKDGTEKYKKLWKVCEKRRLEEEVKINKRRGGADVRRRENIQ